MLKIMSFYGMYEFVQLYSSMFPFRNRNLKFNPYMIWIGEEVVTALGSEVDRLEKEIQEIVPGIRHVDIEAHNPIIPPM